MTDPRPSSLLLIFILIVLIVLIVSTTQYRNMAASANLTLGRVLGMKVSAGTTAGTKPPAGDRIITDGPFEGWDDNDEDDAVVMHLLGAKRRKRPDVNATVNIPISLPFAKSAPPGLAGLLGLSDLFTGAVPPFGSRGEKNAGGNGSKIITSNSTASDNSSSNSSCSGSSNSSGNAHRGGQISKTVPSCSDKVVTGVGNDNIRVNMTGKEAMGDHASSSVRAGANQGNDPLKGSLKSRISCSINDDINEVIYGSINASVRSSKEIDVDVASATFDSLAALHAAALQTSARVPLRGIGGRNGLACSATTHSFSSTNSAHESANDDVAVTIAEGEEGAGM